MPRSAHRQTTGALQPSGAAGSSSGNGARSARGSGETDDLDRSIMKLLLNDARLPSSQIARELRVPEATVRYRVRRLKDRGQLVSVSMPIYGDVLRASFFLRTAPGKTDALIRQLADLECVIYLAIGSGTYDVFVHGVFDNEDEFLEFRNTTLGASPAVTAMETLQFVKIITRRFGFTGFPVPYEPAGG